MIWLSVANSSMGASDLHSSLVRTSLGGSVALVAVALALAASSWARVTRARRRRRRTGVAVLVAVVVVMVGRVGLVQRWGSRLLVTANRHGRCLGVRGLSLSLSSLSAAGWR